MVPCGAAAGLERYGRGAGAAALAVVLPLQLRSDVLLAVLPQ
jgi:hypothetical protein